MLNDGANSGNSKRLAPTGFGVGLRIDGSNYYENNEMIEALLRGGFSDEQWGIAERYSGGFTW